jgi:hypothetical protein
MLAMKQKLNTPSPDIGVVGMAGGTARTRAGQPFPVLAKNYTTEDAPLSAVFGGRGLRPLKPYDFVAASDAAVSAGDPITPTTRRKQTRVQPTTT